MPNSALIVGASSMLGRKLSEYLERQGTRVFTCGRSETCDIRFDLADKRLPDIAGAIRADTVYHCAAAFADDSLAGCIENETANARGAYLVAGIAAEVGCRHLIYAGSISSSTLPGCMPVTSYGASKLRGEEILQWSLARHGIVFTSLRFPQLYDEMGECCRHQLWFGRIVAYAYAGKLLRMPGGNAGRNFIHVRDAVRLMDAAVKRRVAGRLEITHPETLSCEAIARLAYEVFDHGGHFEVAMEKQPFREIYIPSANAAYEHLQCWPEISMLQGLELIKSEGTPQAFGPMDVM